MIKIVLLGAGNLGHHFQKLFHEAENIDLVQWYKRDLSAIEFAEKDTKITNELSQLEDADLYIIAVSDNSIAKVSSQMNRQRLVVHCAGGVDMKILESGGRKGVFYPLQTFTKSHELSFKDLPICIEAEDEKDKITLFSLTKELGALPYEMNSSQREVLHLTAVFINNFGNHLFNIGNKIAKSNNIPFEILNPIILETAKKAIAQGPEISQTGPAIRNDENTIKKHLDLLENTQYKELYLALTASIKQNNE